ncbi:MAG: hypothetical protein MI919_32140 [Holophagales bacterium]|nr:hypothetical protein [Holophagales bacterium]
MTDIERLEGRLDASGRCLGVLAIVDPGRWAADGGAWRGRAAPGEAR